MLAVAAALFASVLVLKLTVRAPGFGFPLLYDIPVALLAIALGIRAGLAGAAVGMVLYTIGDAVGEIHSNVWGYTSRALTFVLLGGLLGAYSDRLRRAEGKTRESEARSQRIAGLGSWQWDIEADVVSWSDELQLLYGTSPNEFETSYEGFLERVHRDDREAVERAVAQARASGEPFELDHRVVRPDGSTLTLHAHGEVIRGDRGSAVAMAGTEQDVTERRAGEEANRRLARNLERSNAELEEFAYVASHDLQEPLRSIAGFAQLLERRYKGQLDAEGDRFIGFIVSGVERLQTLIDDLLSYSRAGAAQVQRAPVDSRQLVEGTLTSLEAVVRETGAEVELGELPTLNADPRVLGQVFQNLLSNALKFTDDRAPRIEVSAEHADGAWSFAVADNGIGIDPGDAKRIFGMFQRLHAREHYAGTGIGLAISKRVIERLGGLIWCEPRPGGGTVFRFTVPDAEPS